jgi:tRNA(Ile)-lysidine synthase
MDHPGRPHRRGLSGVEPSVVAEVDRLVGRTTFPAPGTAVTCAVSGGADSLALLVLAVAAGCEVTAVHVDHGLRPGSASEADVVAAAADRFGARFESRTVVVAPGPNLEARAREARYAVLPDDVCTGHTADDRAETMLLNLLRGAGPAGLGALRPGERHPILDMRRTDTRGLCSALDLAVVEDPSNDDPAFLRNRVRHELLPLMQDMADRDPVPVLVRQAGLFTEVDQLLGELAADVDVTDARALRAAPTAVARTAVRAWMLGAGVGDGHPPSAASVQRVLDVAAGTAKAADVGSGWRVTRSAGRLTLHAPSGPLP